MKDDALPVDKAGISFPLQVMSHLMLDEHWQQHCTLGMEI